ncbi:peptidoglycan-binding protein [Flavobacterium sediminis]|uniref:Peptidoglycan-binding protein n=1 Tax=Flavobacterium sediminis TaxID=2201181 RepID=A0A2U8QV23_9FLAO|nr:L,D-transpeptidase family protein [Flavobacterium sediminis]AWM14062.1 peptidoglycan-binding protein [Flavobacterium sediminis]
MPLKNYFLYVSVFIVLSCNKNNTLATSEDDALLKDQETEEIARPIPETLLEHKSDSIRLYYHLFRNKEIWYNSINRKALLSEIENCGKDGLFSKDYEFAKLSELEKKHSELNDDESIAYDFLLTEMFEKLAHHLHGGKLNPKKIYDDWDLNPKKIALSKRLEKAIMEKQVSQLFDSLKPQHYVYSTIKKSLVLLNAFPDTDFKKIQLAKKIELNDTIDVMINIKKRLAYWNDYKPKDSIITAVYDSITYLAVKKFQNRHGLIPDGVIGNGTIKALNYSKSERREQIFANLERWKWFPDDFGSDYLIANLPEYKIYYIVNKDTISVHNIVVGKPSRKTPVLTSKLSNFVFNPTWTVPPTIIKEDLTPSASKNREYFERNRITIFNKSGEVIAPSDWNPEKAKTFRYVQTSGYNNSLGLVKFNFPNRHLVYLHDTNHRDYFSRETRALSSGCVRIEKPLDLAEMILKKEDAKKWNRTEIDSILSKKNSRIVNLNSTVNVFFLYWTNWSKSNQLYFCNDMYGYDKKLFELLRN